jgi:hypothetical protein
MALFMSPAGQPGVSEPGAEQFKKKEMIMGVVASIEGTFYDIPDSELDKYKVPADQAKALAEKAGPKLPENPKQQPAGQVQGGAGGGQPQILVQFITQGGVATQQMQVPAAPAEGGDETVDPQWYYYYYVWRNWYNSGGGRN